MNNECTLPADKNGDYNLGELGTPCLLSNTDVGKKLISTDTEINDSFAVFMMYLRRTILQDRRSIYVGGKRLTACINWLRDHIHEMKGYKHWEYDLKSYLDFMIENQDTSGFYYEITCVGDNYHAFTADPPLVKFLPKDHLALVRIELEADIEYLVIEGAVTVYKATGDEAWIKKVLPRLEKGIDYCTSSPKRWDAEHGLVKRPYTIDTWDFLNNQSGTDRRIYKNTEMCIMHGDNTGVCRAMRQLAWLNRRFGAAEKANEWEERANRLLQNLNALCWNGEFYTHQVPLNGKELDGLEKTRLSLSNCYALNRGVLTVEQAQKIVESYIKLGQKHGPWYEWCAIYPPYQKFNQFSAGEYINGGAAPFVAGELAKGAFACGYEQYGYELLLRLQKLYRERKELGFLYNPKTGAFLSGGPNGWGASAVLDAIDSGFAGVEDLDVLMHKIRLSPKFVLAPATEMRYFTGYDSAGVLVELRYCKKTDRIAYQLYSPAKTVECHILLPQGVCCQKVLVNHKSVPFQLSQIRQSVYADFTVESGNFSAELLF